MRIALILNLEAFVKMGHRGFSIYMYSIGIYSWAIFVVKRPKTVVQMYKCYRLLKLLFHQIITFIFKS